MQSIDQAATRIEKIARLAQRETQSVDLNRFQTALSFVSNAKDEGTLPCNTIPISMNKGFFGRQHLLNIIDEKLHPVNTETGLSSLALYGLGGVGKTQIALAFAYSKVKIVDAVFWIPSENRTAIEQGYSKIAVEALSLPKAKPQANRENSLLVLDWLRQTSEITTVVFGFAC